MEALILYVAIGFIGGYFARRWAWTNAIAEWLDKMIGHNCEKK